MELRFAGYPTADAYEDVKGEKGRTKLRELLWGEEFELLPDAPQKGFAKIRFRDGAGSKLAIGWMKESEIETERLLEVTFVDIGQGDGCLVVTPDDRKLVIDAGKGDHMSRYLKWRFMYFHQPLEFEAAVISHPDADHYQGFADIFKIENLTFRNLYHNGLVERRGEFALGKTSDTDPSVFTLVQTHKQLQTLLHKERDKSGRKNFPDMLNAAIDGSNYKSKQPRFRNSMMLSMDDRFMPGFPESADLAIEVLGPVLETATKDGKSLRGLRKFPGDDGKLSNSKTKNGHSVVLRMKYKNVKLLLGGDLNIPSEELLLRTIMGGAEIPPVDKPEARTAYMKEARKSLRVDIAKSCHHGSSDFSSLFLEAVNPVATVISSGDAEGFSHPRAETLGAIGVCSRGQRPLIFSTELARSAKEACRDPHQEKSALKKLQKDILKEKDASKKRKLQSQFTKLVDDTINRTVQTFGAIQVRSDGIKVVLAQKLENHSKGKQWDCYVLEPNANGELEFVSQHAD